VEQTLYLLFLQLQLNLQVRERGLNLLKVPICFGVRGIKIFVPPFLLSSFMDEKLGGLGSTPSANHLRRYMLQLPLHCIGLHVFAYKLAEFGVVDIQTDKSSVG